MRAWSGESKLSKKHHSFSRSSALRFCLSPFIVATVALSLLLLKKLHDGRAQSLLRVRASHFPVYNSVYSSSDSGKCYRLKEDSVVIHCLPSFIIIGAMKSGTGELMKWLNMHPLIKSGSGITGKKEMHFFKESGFHNVTSYLLQFPGLSPNGRIQYATFDKSPDYIRNIKKIRNIRAILPSVKLLAILRNPSDRAISEFRHNCRHRRYMRVLEPFSVTLTMNETASSSASERVTFHYRRGDIVNADSPSVNPDMSTAFSAFEIFSFQGRTRIVSNDTSYLPQRTFRRNILASLRPSAYEVLRYPCSNDDLKTYFCGSQCARGGYPVESSDEANLRALFHKGEITHGYYNAQIRSVLRIFPKEQLLILFQEDMERNTFSTLSKAVEFIGTNPFDFSSYQSIWTIPGGPPIRRSSSFADTLSHMKAYISWLIGKSYCRKCSKAPWYRSRIREDLSDIKRFLNSIYKNHSQSLKRALNENFGPSVFPIPESWAL